MGKNKQRAHDTLAAEAASQLYLLSWYDALDRLDTLLLEARHLQVNIISTLRTPELLRVLRYEEKHLWGKDWNKGFKKYSLNELVDHWMFVFPHPHSLDSFASYYETTETPQEVKDLADKLHRTIKNTIKNGDWGNEQYHGYYTLQAIQHLKREIFRDKLVLSQHALNQSKLYKHTHNFESKAEFMILRGAILFNAEMNYIEQLKNLQTQLSRTIDVLSEGIPRSSVNEHPKLTHIGIEY